VQTLEDRISCGFCYHHPSVPGIAAVRQQRGFMQHTQQKYSSMFKHSNQV
jgi:hypothetical protein